MKIVTSCKHPNSALPPKLCRCCAPLLLLVLQLGVAVLVALRDSGSAPTSCAQIPGTAEVHKDHAFGGLEAGIVDAGHRSPADKRYPCSIAAVSYAGRTWARM